MDIKFNEDPNILPDNQSEEIYDDKDEWKTSGGESVVEKPTMERFFDTENILYSIEKQMRGYQKKDNRWVYVTRPVARDEFINSMINSLRSVMNEGAKLSSKTTEECKFLLLEKNKQFIYDCLDEPTLEEKDMESVINIFDHSLELFMGIVEGGIGNKTLRDISASVSNDFDRRNENKGFGINLGEKNLITLGGRK